MALSTVWSHWPAAGAAFLSGSAAGTAVSIHTAAASVRARAAQVGCSLLPSPREGREFGPRPRPCKQGAGRNPAVSRPAAKERRRPWECFRQRWSGSARPELCADSEPRASAPRKGRGLRRPGLLTGCSVDRGESRTCRTSPAGSLRSWATCRPILRLGSAGSLLACPRLPGRPGRRRRVLLQGRPDRLGLAARSACWCGRAFAPASSCGSGSLPGPTGRGSSPWSWVCWRWAGRDWRLPWLAVLCGAVLLFMGVTACLAYMFIDLERYEVGRGYKAVHNPLKGQELAVNLVRYGHQVGVPLLAAASVAARRRLRHAQPGPLSHRRGRLVQPRRRQRADRTRPPTWISWPIPSSTSSASWT